VTAKGDCFMVAWRMVLDHKHLTLAHGTAVGQGKIEGIHHAHAWCEYEEDGIRWCVDHSNGKEITFPAVIYYRIGQIYDVTLYERETALATAVRLGHFGPWEDDEPARVVGGDPS
jgi:hypothetical protein